MPHPSADGGGVVIEADDAGVIGEHAEVQVQPFLVAPTREDLGNGLSLDIIPMACLNLGDVLFEFDSSVVTPAAGDILSKLPALRRSKPNAKGDLPLVSVFAHADPSGDDDYNKTLAGRRARAVYALLVHDVGAWESLYKTPFGGDDWSKKMNPGGMADAVNLPHGTPRHELFDAFMTLLMPEPLDRADFLGRGADPKGKADHQGCGEFNPLLMLSAEDQTKLKKEERNALNLVNRRVVIFLFRPEVKVDVGSWPCPRSDEGPAACHKRFFKNAAQRRTPGPERVKHTGPASETFACRFYDRMAGASPCEQILLQYRVRLFDKQANPLPGAPFTISDGKRKVVGRAGDDAFATIRDIKVPADIEVQWNPAGDDSQKFELTVHVEIEGQDESASLRRLHNLGYEGFGSQEDDVRAFQRDHADRFPGMAETGALDPATADALQQVNDGCDPSVRGAAPPPKKGDGPKRLGAEPHKDDPADAGDAAPASAGDGGRIVSDEVPQAPAVPDPFAPGSLIVNVVLLNSSPVVGAEVTVTRGELMSKAGVTDAHGDITFKDLPSADYDLKIVFPGHGVAPETGKVVVGPVTGTVHVDPGPEPTIQPVTLAAPGLAFLRVQVHDDKLKAMAAVPVDIDEAGLKQNKKTNVGGFAMFGPLPAPGTVAILAGNTDFAAKPHFALANAPPDAVIFERASSQSVLSEGQLSKAVLQLAERKLEIVKIDANFAPSVETCDITYAIKGLAKRKVTLTIEGANYAGKTIVSRDLSEKESADGEHNVIAFTGKVEVGADKDQFIHPLMGPFTVRLEHVDSKNLGILKSEKTFKVLYHSVVLAFGKHTPDETTPDKNAEQNKFVQAKLNELGYDAGPVTGTVDAVTQGAIRRFERASYLPGAASPMPETGAVTGNLVTVLESASKRDIFETGKNPLTQDARFYVYDNFMCDRDNDVTQAWASAGPPAQTGRIPTGNLTQFNGMNRAPASEDKMERAFIPLEVEIKLKNKAGAAVSAPQAVGPVPVAFEAKDDTEDDSVISADPKAKTYVQHAREIGTTATVAGAPRIDGSGDNAPVAQGGFRPVLSADYVKVWFPDAAGSKLAPFAVAKYDTETRGAQTFDRAIVNAFRHPSDFPKRLGRAGLYLRMSTKGGDDCKVRVSLSFKGLPNQTDLEADHPATNAELVKETGKWTVWRRTRFSAYCPQTVGSRLPATPQWNAVRDIWKEAYLEVENNGQPLQILNYSAIVDAAAYRAAIMALPSAGQPTNGINKDVTPNRPWQAADFNYDPTALYGGPYPPFPQPQGPAPATPPAPITNFFSGYSFYVPPVGSGEDAGNYVTRAGNFMILWVAPTFGAGVVNAMLSLLHKHVRKTSAEGYVIFDYRVAQPISGQDWDPTANGGAGGFVPTANPFARNRPTGHRGWVNADGAVTMNLDNGYNVDEYVAHECGHARFLYHHAFTGATPPAASSNPTHHDADQLDCTMSYAPPGTPGNHPAFHFCGKCLLRLRGWNVFTLPNKYA